jgi:hypothetical protein
MAHDWVMAYSFYDSVETDDFMDYVKNVAPALYSDDHIINMTNDVQEAWTAPAMVASYAKCGFTLKPESMLDTPGTLEGHTFLGSEIRKIYVHQREYFIGVPDGQKAIGALLHTPKLESDDQVYTRACSLEVEYFFSDKRDTLKGLCDYLETSGAHFLPSEVIDSEHWFSAKMNRRFTQHEIMALYLGLESSSLF